jgi:hypothetical protein
MPIFAFAMPVVPGKEETDEKMLQQLSGSGPEHDAYVAARRAQGFSRELVFHQKTPMGTFALIILEGDDPAASLGKVATSDEPFAVQFREFVKEVHNVDLAKDPPPEVKLLMDTRF